MRRKARVDDNQAELSFVIPGAPRTKKTSNRLVTNRQTGRRFILPSAAFEAWNKNTQLYLMRLRMIAKGRDWIAKHASDPVQIRAIFYRDANRGDFTGYAQALADALEESGLIVNDKQIVSWDGSYLSKAKDEPRIQVTLRSLADVLRCTR